MESYDDEWESCLECGSTDFSANHTEWERVCTNCGITSCYELFNYIPADIPYFYKHENYFRNTIINNAICKGAPIADIEEHLMQMFHKSLCLFHLCKRKMKRDNYPSYQYALLKLCAHLNRDVSTYIKLPKMKKTLEGAERDWLMIDPTTQDY